MSLDEKSRWIWTDDWTSQDKHDPRLVYFRKKVKLQDPQFGELKISADSRYKLFINNQLVEVGPRKGDHQVWYLDKVNIQKYICPGENIFAVAVLRYPLEQEKGNYSVFRTEYPGLIISGKIVENNEKQISKVVSINTDSSWKCFVNRKFKIFSESDDFAPLQIYEKVQGNKFSADWKKTSFEEKNWKTAKMYSQFEISRQVSPGNLLERSIPFLYRKTKKFEKVVRAVESSISTPKWENLIKKRNQVSIPAHTTEKVEFSAGEEMTGYLHLAIEGGLGTKIRILQSEGYVQDEMTSTNGLPIPVKTDRTDSVNGHLDGFTDYYTAGGWGTDSNPEVYEPFWLRTFRYVQLEIVTDQFPLTLDGFWYDETGYPLKVKTDVRTSDPSLKEIWNISERTLRRCMHETYEDCPFYEQIQYAMDSRSQILFTYAISGDDRLAKACMEDLKRSQRYDGLLNCSWPNFTSNVIPTFSIYYILMVFDHMMYFGDKELVKHHFTTIINILEYFNNHISENGYVKKIGGLNIVDRFWSFTDWTQEWRGTSGVPAATFEGPLTVESLVYLMGLQAAIKIAKYINQDEFAKELRSKEKKLIVAIKNFCIGRNGMLQDGPGIDDYSQQTQVFGILTGVLDLENGKKILLETLEDKEKYAQCSVAMSFYLFRAMEKVNLYKKTDALWNTWREMLRKHLTTCVEAVVGDRSDCHGWGAVALYELPAVVLGVRPAAPGFEKITLDPQLGYLDWAEGKVITPKGLVKVSCKKQDGKIKVKALIPKNIKITTKYDISYEVDYY